MSEVIAEVAPSAVRRFISAGVLAGLGVMFIYLAASRPPPGLHWIAIMVGCGLVLIYGGHKLWHSTDRAIELTEDELRMSDGTVLCKVEDVAKIDRSFFAFKPSNGFLVTTKVSYPRAWVPGLWWRMGKRIGVGGVTPGAGCKVMSDRLVVIIAERDGLLDHSPFAR
ncbi:MAG: hypothetical protein HKP40_08875 [Litoreibacter sp.]|nr:hypothetical protein [Litoreibacter sp.]